MNSLGMTLRAALICGAATLGLAAQVRAADFVNGSFETGTSAGWTAQRWAVQGGGTDGSFEADTPCSGDPCTDLSNTSGNAELSQLLTGLTDGASYTVTFDARSNGTTPNALDVYVDSVEKLDLSDFAASFTTYTLGFTASGTTASFAVLGRNDPFITEVDNFHLSADGGAGGVPEPAAWSLMILGFGMAGAMARRQRLAGAYVQA